MCIGKYKPMVVPNCIILCIVDCILHCSSAILQGGEFWAARRRTGAVTELCGCPHPPNLHHHHHRHCHHHQPPRHCHYHHLHRHCQRPYHHLNHNKSMMNSSALLDSILIYTKICKKMLCYRHSLWSWSTLAVCPKHLYLIYANTWFKLNLRLIYIVAHPTAPWFVLYNDHNTNVMLVKNWK